jgi:hypothetical protein
MKDRKKFIIRNISDLYILKSSEESYDEVIICAEKLKYTGVIPYALKYAYWSLNLMGIIKIFDSPHSTFAFQKNKIGFWQVRYLCAKILGNFCDFIEVDNNKGEIILQKNKEYEEHNGISFGVIFSGSDSDEKLLFQAIESIIDIDKTKDFPYEIIICGPSVYDKNRLVQLYGGNNNIKYLPFDFEANGERLMICQKKNYIFTKSKYSIVSISHTRIKFSNDFVAKLKSRHFDFCTPAVYYSENNFNYHYLDFLLIGGYDDIFIVPKLLPLGGYKMLKNYLFRLKGRFPAIDGGLNIFNKHIIQTPPYDDKVAWGEAEDLDLSARLFNQGVLIDFLYDIKCFSMTNKLWNTQNSSKNLYIKLRQYFEI